MTKHLKNQSGVSIVATIIVLLILSLFIAVAVSLVTTGANISVQEIQGQQALNIAEGGLERAVYRFKTGTFCTSINETNVALAQGDFDITGTINTTSSTLSAVIAAGATTIPVTSSAGFISPGRIMIDNEMIDYYGISGNNLINAVRGVGGTTAAAHSAGSIVGQDMCRIVSTGMITSNPLATVQRVVEKNLQNPGAMMAYAKANGDGTPYIRRWYGTQWGAEQTATAVPANIQYLLLKFARTRNEAILGTLSSNGDIRVQVWNGTTWSATTLLANIGTTNDAYRGFDIEYETGNDRAVVVYNNANAADPSYRIWNGTSWSAAAVINIPTTGAPYWIELAPYPLTNLARCNEISMLILDANADVYGMRWTGAAWNNMGVAGVWDNSASTATRKAMNLAYEQLTGRAMFIWGSSTNDRQRWRIWDGANLGGINNLDINTMGGAAYWIRLEAQPNSNNLLYGVQDGGNDLNTRFWNGAAWDGNPPHAEHDNNTESTDKNFDIVFETFPANAGRAWLLWGNGSSVSIKQWTGAAWGAASTVGDDTALIEMIAHPRSGAIFGGIYERSTSTTQDIWEMHLLNGGAAWSAKFTAWGGPTVASPVMGRVFIANEVYTPVIRWREVIQ